MFRSVFLSIDKKNSVMEISQEGSSNNTQKENTKDLGGKEAVEKLR